MFIAKQMPTIQKGNLFLLLTFAVLIAQGRGDCRRIGFIGKGVGITIVFGTPSSFRYIDRNLCFLLIFY
jgi:hypothetical protein